MEVRHKIYATLSLILLLGACSGPLPDENEQQPTRETIEASIGICMGDDTRTWLGDDGMATYWSAGDRIALWARNAAGEYCVEAAGFSLRHFSPDYSTALFTGRITAMEQGDYDYFMIYPVPTSVEGTKASYVIPAVQSGRYDAQCDVMISPATRGGALSADLTAEVSATMHHMMHAVKITIPQGRNLFGQRFTRLEMTFPYPVTGRVTYDVTRPDDAPTVSEPSNTLVIESAEGFDAGDTLWAFVLPSAAPVEGEIGYMVSNGRSHSESAAYDVRLDTRPGHVTPIKMTVPSIYKYTVMEFRVGENNLGENFNTLNVYDASGALVATFPYDASGVYKKEYYGDFDHPEWSGTDFTLSFDSEHAIVNAKVNVGTIEPYSYHSFDTAVPYLFEEDFDSIADFSDGHDNKPTNIGNADLGNGSSMFDAQGLVGWSGYRIGVGGSGGKSIRICCRTNCTLFNNKYRYHGRLDSPRLTALKDGVEVDLEVTLNYAGGYAGSSSLSPIAAYGYDISSAGAINSKTLDTGWDISDPTQFPTLPLDGSFDAVPQQLTYTISRGSNIHRLSWEVGSVGYDSNSYNNYWLYLDNIRVKIKQ